jgi:hypothetical protein
MKRLCSARRLAVTTRGRRGMRAGRHIPPLDWYRRDGSQISAAAGAAVQTITVDEFRCRGLTLSPGVWYEVDGSTV